MDTLVQYHEIAAVTITRLFLGFLFFFQGYDAVLKIGLSKVQNTFRDGFAGKPIPLFLIDFASWYTSLSALIGGIFLTLGLFETLALFILGVNLLIAGIGFGITNPLWDVRNVFPRLILLLILLFTPAHWNQWTLDKLFFNI